MSYENTGVCFDEKRGKYTKGFKVNETKYTVFGNSAEEAQLNALELIHKISKQSSSSDDFIKVEDKKSENILNNNIVRINIKEIKLFIEKHKLNQSQFATLVGVANSTISIMLSSADEYGECNIRRDVYEKLKKTIKKEIETKRFIHNIEVDMNSNVPLKGYLLENESAIITPNNIFMVYVVASKFAEISQHFKSKPEFSHFLGKNRNYVNQVLSRVDDNGITTIEYSAFKTIYEKIGEDISVIGSAKTRDITSEKTSQENILPESNHEKGCISDDFLEKIREIVREETLKAIKEAWQEL